MRRLILLYIIFFPFLLISQGSKQEKINWISLEKAEKFAAKYNQDILIFFYKPNCEYCDKMKKETISDPDVIKLINNNFLPVKLNGYSKDTIVFDGEIYGNEQPAEKGHFWRHDFFFKFGRYKDGVITPSLVLINSQMEKVTQFTGFMPKIQLIRGIKGFIKK